MNGRRTRKQQIMTMSIIAVAIITLSIGFAAFSSTLRISSTAAVNPDSGNFSVVFSSNAETLETNAIAASPSTYGDPATIENGAVPTISDLNAKFTQPGQTVTYTFYALNKGAYLAYLNYINFNNVEGESKNIKCEAGEGTTASLVEQACNGISISVKVGSDAAVTTNQSGISNHTLIAGDSETVVVTISYTGDSVADGPFNVTFGDIELIYSTVADYVQNGTSTPSVTPICTAVTEENATKSQLEPIFTDEGEVFDYAMNIPTGQYNIGDEYVCEVAPNTKHHFFILSKNADETINLILEGNITERTEYISQSDYTTAGGTLSTSTECTEGGSGCVTLEKGPITAYAKLKEATDGWSNVPDLTKTYTSSDGQYTFTMSGKARMPEVSEFRGGWWLYLRTDYPFYMLQKQNNSLIDGVFEEIGYWLMNDLDQTNNSATASSTSIPADTPEFSVRPVITVQKGHLQ